MPELDADNAPGKPSRAGTLATFAAEHGVAVDTVLGAVAAKLQYTLTGQSEIVMDDDTTWFELFAAVAAGRGARPDGDLRRQHPGYFEAALQAALRDPGASHEAASLVDERELQFQLDELAGPRIALPDKRFHELFEEEVRRHPDAVAATQGAEGLSYDALNRRANRIAHGLLARGVRPEDPVAVIAERNLDWMATVLGVFKAGGCYLPIEPHFPPDRIAGMLRRSDCRHVLAEKPLLDHGGPSGADLIADVLTEPQPDTDPGVAVGPDHLAYIYFTSGSTGEPKGAMCEHAGFLNHLQAKIADLGLHAGDTVAQTAPQCFDISLWQLVAGLLVGARTHIVEQDAVLDVARFAGILARERVTVLQLVPSYLDVLLHHLDDSPRELPALRCVSVTGEALKKPLVARWFAAFGDVALVNAYGLTETSDDTNHEVMRRVPDEALVPVGRPVQNADVRVVDSRLRPVPLGAPGEIVFAGVCVGRGYINDPERSRAAFGADPYRPGGRLYRSGDFGRWLPDGRLEFLGRRDAQVKVRGFRIEIGEVENALLRCPGVRDGAVLVAGERLVAYYTGPAAIETAVLVDSLAELLPEYMIPSRFSYLPELPLTANGKVDRKQLRARDAAGPAADGPAAVADGPALSDAERHLATVWAELLDLDVATIGPETDFFGVGGTSLSAVRLGARLGTSLAELGEHSTLRALADLVTRSEAAQ